MNEAATVQIPKTADGKFAFKSQEDYASAVQREITGGRHDTLESLLNPDMVAIDAQVQIAPQEPASSSSYSQEPKPEPIVPPQVAPQATLGLAAKLRERAKKEGLDLDGYETEDQIVEALIAKEKRISFLDKQTAETMRSGMSETEKKELEALRSRVTELQKGTVKNEKTINFGESKIDRINELREKIAKTEDPYDPEVMKMRTELDTLAAIEMARLNSVIKQIPEVYEEKFTQLSERINGMGTELRTAKEAEEIQAAKASSDRLVSDFQQKHGEFATSKSIFKIDEEYVNWSDKLFFATYGRRPANDGERKYVVNQFLNKDPRVQQKVAETGLESPKEIEKYLQICDLMAMKDRLDAATNGNHTLEQVWQYKMIKDGTLEEAMKAQRAIGASAVTAATTKRDTDFATVLDRAGGPGNSAPSQMKPEDALKVLDAIDPIEAKRNPELAKKRAEAYSVLQIQTD